MPISCEAEELVCDLRWAGIRLVSAGLAAVAADMSIAGTERADWMRMTLGQTAHLLAPAVPEWAVVDILHSRLADDQDCGVQAVLAARTLMRRSRRICSSRF